MKTKLHSLTIVLLVLSISSVYGQGVGIGATSFTPASDAVLELRSSTSGFLMPRMTQAQRLAIASPSNGLLVYQTDGVPAFYYYNSGVWKSFGGDDLGDHQASSTLVMNDNIISNSAGGEGIRISNDGNVGIGPMAASPSSRLQIVGGDVRISPSSGISHGVRLENPAGTFASTIKAGAQVANISYTLPTAAPVVNGAVLASTTSGVMSWDSFLKPTVVTASGNDVVNPASYNAGTIAGMSVASVPAGTYLVTFNADITRNGSSACQCIVRAAGADVSDTERRFEIQHWRLRFHAHRQGDLGCYRYSGDKMQKDLRRSRIHCG